MQAANINQSATMTSREIAELTGKDHGHVMRDIRAMLESLGGQSNFGGTYLDAQGKERPCFHLPYNETICLLTGYDPKSRMAVIKRWQELEAQKTQVMALPDFNNPAIAARAWAEQYEAKTLALEVVETQKTQLAIAAPKVAIYEVLADRKQDVSTTVIAKHLGTTAIKLNQFLREKGVKWLNADLPKAGYMEWFNVISDVKNGYEFQQCVVTPLGQIKIAELWAES